MKVSELRETLQRLETEGRGECDLYVSPTPALCRVSHLPGTGVMIGFDFDDHPVEVVDDAICQPDDSDVVFLGFGLPDVAESDVASRAGLYPPRPG